MSVRNDQNAYTSLSSSLLVSSRLLMMLSTWLQRHLDNIAAAVDDDVVIGNNEK